MLQLFYSLSVFTLILIFSIQQRACSETIQVTLKQGVLSGIVNKTFITQQTFFSFRGIPYAETPTGKLRFLPPNKHQGWTDVYTAHFNKPTCVQYSLRMRNGEPPGISGSEDCLYISVFTPSLNGFVPVVIFDYNDNFRTGFNGTDTYSPDFFIEEDIIVVTISHRLDIFGYLSTEDDVIPGNVGIKDFILGLNWIKDNIKQFGGDASRVTLMGSKGGAALANILLYSEKAKGLFSGIIMQSGTALEPIYFYKNIREKSFKLGEQFDIITDDSRTLLQELQKVDPEILVDKMFHVLDSQFLYEYQMNVFPFAPIIELNSSNSILKNLPENSKIVNDVPVLIGMNSREGLDLISEIFYNPLVLDSIDRDLLFTFPIRTNLKFVHNSSIHEHAEKEIMNFYFQNGTLNYENILKYSIYVGDINQMYALDYAAKKLASDLKSSVYYYLFDFKGSLNENFQFISQYSRFPLENWGATIGDELCYLHLCSRIKRHYEQFKKRLSEPMDIKMLRKMVRLWTNFVKTGKPTPTKDDDILKDFTWTPIEKNSENKNYLHIKKSFKMMVNPLGEREKFWNNFLKKYSQMAVNGVILSKDDHDEL